MLKLLRWPRHSPRTPIVPSCSHLDWFVLSLLAILLIEKGFDHVMSGLQACPASACADSGLAALREQADRQGP